MPSFDVGQEVQQAKFKRRLTFGFWVSFPLGPVLEVVFLKGNDAHVCGMVVSFISALPSFTRGPGEIGHGKYQCKKIWVKTGKGGEEAESVGSGIDNVAEL